MFTCSKCQPKSYTLDEFEYCINTENFYVVKCSHCNNLIKVFEFENKILVTDIYDDESTIDLITNVMYDEEYLK